MRTTIKIECHTIAEIIAHLDVAKKELKRIAKKEGLDVSNSEFVKRVELSDDNRYGSHRMIINP